MKKYEMMFIIPSKYTEAELDDVIKKVTDIMETAGAAIADTFNMGKRRLAYPISHQRNGTYILVNFEAESESILKMDNVLRLTEEVLRHMIVEQDSKLKQLTQFTDNEERRSSDDQRERQPKEAPPIQAKTIPSAASSDNVNIKELDKKLDEILTEEVL